MKIKRLSAALLFAATLLSGCTSAAGTVSTSGGEPTDKPLSQLEQLTLQTQKWEQAGTYDDEDAYRQALLQAADLVQEEDRGTYRCDTPNELSADKLAALTDAGMRCHYVYSLSSLGHYDPFSEEDLPAAIGMLILYTPGTLEQTSCWNMQGNDPSVPPGNYCYVKKEAIQPFLDGAVAPVAQAFREYGDDLSAWDWYEGEDGYIYVNVTGLTATLPYSEPDLISVEPLGGNRYLVVSDMIPSGTMVNHQMAYVVEDTALPGEAPHVVVLDCMSKAAEEDKTIHADDLEALRTKYRVLGKDGQQALDLLDRLSALSPIPYGTELNGQISSAMQQALYDALCADEEITSEEATFEDYVAALQIRPTMHRYFQEDPWLPSDADHTIPYGDEWNLIPAAELEAAFQRRFGLDLTAHDRAWLNNKSFVLNEYVSGMPMAQWDGENYMIYMNGRGGPGISPDDYQLSLIYNYDGTYTARFTFLPMWLDDTGRTSTLHLRNVGTQEEPFFQLLGYELPA